MKLGKGLQLKLRHEAKTRENQQKAAAAQPDLESFFGVPYQAVYQDHKMHQR
jgi:hypothetical protein